MIPETCGDAKASERLALGTVQFGQSYGVANRRGQVAATEVGDILALARAAGIRTLDTAILYGNAEEQLGAAGADGFEVISKLSGIPAGCADVAAWAEEEVRRSLARLRIPRLAGLLLHRPLELTGPRGGELAAALVALRTAGLAAKIGVSVYEPAELEAIWPRLRPEIVQAPFSLLDRRLESSGWLERLADAGIEVHVRSVFLQGLLLMPTRPAHFARWPALWRAWDEWRDVHPGATVAACLHFALARVAVTRVIVGVDGRDHLREIVAAANAPRPAWPDEVRCDDPALLTPSLWPKS